MPQDFRCNQCELRFSLGPFHYHQVNTGYGGMLLLVCTSCGTQHGLESALRDRGPEFYEIQKVVVEHVPSPVPPILVKWVRSKKPHFSLADALACARCPPFVLEERMYAEPAARVRDELAALSVVARVELIERERNPIFGPLCASRLCAATGPSTAEHLHSPMPRMQEIAADQDRVGGTFQSLTCLHCGTQGTLIWRTGSEEDDVAQESEAMPCPRCKTNELLTEGGWIT